MIHQMTTLTMNPTERNNLQREIQFLLQDFFSCLAGLEFYNWTNANLYDWHLGNRSYWKGRGKKIGTSCLLKKIRKNKLIWIFKLCVLSSFFGTYYKISFYFTLCILFFITDFWSQWPLLSLQSTFCKTCSDSPRSFCSSGICSWWKRYF